MVCNLGGKNRRKCRTLCHSASFPLHEWLNVRSFTYRQRSANCWMDITCQDAIIMLTESYPCQWMNEVWRATAKPLWKLRQQSCFLGLNLDMLFVAKRSSTFLVGHIQQNDIQHPKLKRPIKDSTKQNLFCEFRSLCFSTIPFKMKELPFYRFTN